MKRNKLITLGALAVALLAGNASCIKDFSEEMPAPQAEGFAVSFGTGLQGFATRATVEEGEGLREDYVDHVDVFIFNGATGQIVDDGNGGTCYWHVDAQQMEEGQTQTGTLLDGDWKDTPLSGRDYDVYVVANLHEGNPSLANVKSVADLQTVIEKDEAIYKAEGSRDSGNNPYNGKLFTMTGRVEGFNPQTVQEDEYVLPVTLTRVAAKIEISVALTQDFLQDFRPQSFTQQLKNYAPTALLLEGRDGTHAYEPQSGLTYDPVLVQSPQAGTATLVLYTYPTEWTQDILRETYVILNIPGTRQNSEEGQQAYTGSNFYKIPLRAVADAKQLERNHIYRVNASIGMMGTYTPDTPLELQTVKYEVADWVDEEVTITGDDPRYLMLSEDTIIMKNVDTSSLQEFTSSSYLAPSGDNEDYAIELLRDVAHTYTYNKFGQPQALSNSLLNQIQRNIQFQANSLTGTITINSPVPTNNGVRYMTFRVTNSQGSDAYFLVKQYPLEYITSTEGVRGYRQDGQYSQSTYRALKASEQYGNGTYTIYYTNHNGTSNNGSVNGLNNARMYHIMITSTGGILEEGSGWEGDTYYTLANPLVDDDGYTIPTEENTNLVAPSFMIASQLGASYPMSYENARRHCNQYREVTKVVQPDGTTREVTYSGWRIPTLAELKIIKKFQREDDSAMDVILTGDEYWYAYETISSSIFGTRTTHYTYNPNAGRFEDETQSNTSGNVRCVRTSSEPMAD